MTEEACRDQAHRNFKVYEDLKAKPYVDWAATALFYAAMHDVNAWLIEKGCGAPTSHRNRETRMTSAGVPLSVFAAYKRLRDVSYTARYYEWQGSIDNNRLEGLERDQYVTVHDHCKQSCEI